MRYCFVANVPRQFPLIARHTRTRRKADHTQHGSTAYYPQWPCQKSPPRIGWIFVRRALYGSPAIGSPEPFPGVRRNESKASYEQASKVTTRMPTLRPFGERCTSGEAIDACTV